MIFLTESPKSYIDDRLKFANTLREAMGLTEMTSWFDDHAQEIKKLAYKRDLADWLVDHLLMNLLAILKVDDGFENLDPRMKFKAERMFDDLRAKYGYSRINYFFSQLIDMIEHALVFKDYQPIKNYEYTKKPYEEVKSDLEELKNNYASDKITADEIQPEDEILIEFPDGSAWFLLPRKACSIEARKMGHCGNTVNPKEGERLLSYRTREKGGWVPHLTFLINKDGYLIELKGRNNQKPSRKYNDVIVALLKHPIIKGFGEPKYDASNDWGLEMLEPEQIESLKEQKPEIIKTYNESKPFTIEEFIETFLNSGMTFEEFYRSGVPHSRFTPEKIKEAIEELFYFWINKGEYYDFDGDMMILHYGTEYQPPLINKIYEIADDFDFPFDQIYDIDSFIEDAINVLQRHEDYKDKIPEDVEPGDFDGNQKVEIEFLVEEKFIDQFRDEIKSRIYEGVSYYVPIEISHSYGRSLARENPETLITEYAEEINEQENYSKKADIRDILKEALPYVDDYEIFEITITPEVPEYQIEKEAREYVESAFELVDVDVRDFEPDELYRILFE